MSKAFVTGVTGFVGANLARVLLERGHEVKALVRASSDLGSVSRHEGMRSGLSRCCRLSFLGERSTRALSK
jgi:nucleoside-diphosphate-sugar epimerase